MSIFDFLFEITEQKLNKMIEKNDVKGLIKALDKGKGDIRKRAAETLGTLKKPEAVEPLILLLAEDDEDLKIKSIDALGKIEDGRAVTSLIETLKDENLKIRETATIALKKIGLHSMTPGQRAFYFLAVEEWYELLKLGEASVDTLITAMKEGDTEVRENAAKTLESLGTIAVPHFIGALQDAKWYVRERAAEGLGTLEDRRAIQPLIKLLEDENFRVQQKTCWALGKMGDEAVLPLLAILNNRGAKIRAEAANALGDLRDIRAVEPLTAALREHNPRLRAGAAEALGNIGDRSAVRPLIEALNDRESGIRKEAAEALGKIRDENSLEPLVRTLQDMNTEIRNTVVKSLANFGEPAVENLIEALKFKTWFVREGAAVALGEIGDNRAVQPLLEALKDENEYVRSEAAKALGKTGDKKAYYPVLRLLLDSERGAVRAAAAEALGSLQDERAVQNLIASLRDKDADVSEKSALALAKIGEPALEGLLEVIKLLSNSDIRDKAVIALGNIGDPRAVVPMLPLLRDRNPKVCERTAEMLGQIPDPRAIGHILKACEGGFLDKIAAAKALEKILWANKDIKEKQETILCRECYSRFGEYAIKTPLFNDNRRIIFSACRNCGSGQYFDDADEIIAYLDKKMMKKHWQNDGKLFVNWLKVKIPFDFDSVVIMDVGEYEVEEFIMKIRNDNDSERVSRLKEIKVMLSPGCPLPQLKLNLLEETFGEVEME